jgi:beta propeller repeat protein
VWEDNRNGNSDIYMYDISTDKEEAICTDKADQKNPSIWGNRILWEDYRNGNWDIYMRYLNYFTSSDPPEDLEFWPLTVFIDIDYDVPSNQTRPKISHNTLAFQDDRDSTTSCGVMSLSLIL